MKEEAPSRLVRPPVVLGRGSEEADRPPWEKEREACSTIEGSFARQLTMIGDVHPPFLVMVAMNPVSVAFFTDTRYWAAETYPGSSPPRPPWAWAVQTTDVGMTVNGRKNFTAMDLDSLQDGVTITEPEASGTSRELAVELLGAYDSDSSPAR
jgi:hypothetical protein